MTWIQRTKSLFYHFLAIQLREQSRRHTASVLRRLDDRVLAEIGVPRSRIAEYAQQVAHRAVPVPPMPNTGRKSVLARLRYGAKRRAAIRELSSLDDRLLRDIGIEPGQIDEVVDVLLSQHRDLGSAQPASQLSDAVQEVFVPARRRSSAPATVFPSSRMPMRNDDWATFSADRTLGLHALHLFSADDSQHPERRRHASVGV